VIRAAQRGGIEELKRLKKEGYDFNVVDRVSIYYTCYSSLAASPSDILQVGTTHVSLYARHS